jgi:hypothetical protein
MFFKKCNEDEVKKIFLKAANDENGELNSSEF